MITRMFEYVGGGSDKFWEVTYPDWSVDRGVRTWTCRWGRRGTDGQSKTFTEHNQLRAQDAALAKIAEKQRKGYGEVVRPGVVPRRESYVPSPPEAPRRTTRPKATSPPPVSYERPKRKITLG